MNISISVAATPCAMPQIMFAGDLEARCALLAGLGYDGIDMFFPDPQGTDARTAKAALDRNGLRATMLAAQGDLMADGLYLNDAGRLSELLERSKYHLEQCAVLGAMPNIGFIRGWHRNDPGSLPRMADGLAAYCQLAASFGGRARGTDLPLRNRLHPYNGSGHRPVRACRKTRQSRAPSRSLPYEY
ncbi:MAG: sugar phosphate isomerase/epimerase family protein [Bilophila wadsworthia]